MNLKMEKQNLKQAHLPVDLNTAAITGARIKLDSGDRCAVVISMGDSTAAVVQVTMRQHNAASAGTSKDLSVDNPYYHKKGAATSFTKVVPSSAAALVDASAQFADDEGILVLEVLSEQLDNDNGYYWFSVDIADSTAAKLAASVYEISDCRQNPAYSTAL